MSCDVRELQVACAWLGRASMKRVGRPVIGLLMLAVLFGLPAGRGMAEPCGSWTGQRGDPLVQLADDNFPAPLAGGRTALNAEEAPYLAINVDRPAVARQALYLDASLAKHAGQIGRAHV